MTRLQFDPLLCNIVKSRNIRITWSTYAITLNMCVNIHKCMYGLWMYICIYFHVYLKIYRMPSKHLFIEILHIMHFHLEKSRILIKIGSFLDMN